MRDAIFVSALRGVLELHVISAGREVRERRAEREDGRHRFIVNLLDGDIFVEHLDAHILAALLVIDVEIVVLRRAFPAPDRLPRERAVGNAVDGYVELRDVDGLKAEAVRLKPRQDDAVADEADIGRLVAIGDRHLGRAPQLLAGFRRRAGAHARLVFLVEGEPGEAEALPGDSDRRPGVRRHAHIVGVICLAGCVEFARELETGARLIPAGLKNEPIEGEGLGFFGGGSGRAFGTDVLKRVVARFDIVNLDRAPFRPRPARMAAIDRLACENARAEGRQHGAGADHHQFSVHPRLLPHATKSQGRPAHAPLDLYPIYGVSAPK